MQHKRKTPEGIEAREGTRGTKYRAAVWSPRDKRLIRKQFDSLAEAKAWRVDALSALHKGVLRPAAKATIKEAGEEWLRGARKGLIRNRSGHLYKPGAIRSYETSLRLRVYPELGALRP